MSRVVVLGAGYAGMRAVKFLQKELPANDEIILVNDSPIHTEKTNLHEVAAGTIAPVKITYQIEDVIHSRVKFQIGVVTKVDVDAKQVSFKDGSTLSYDYVIVALGFRSEDFGLKGASDNALPLFDIQSAEAIQKHIEDQIAGYAQTKDENALNVIVCGAGFTGIELVGEFTRSLPRLAKKYNTPEIKVTNIEMATQILPMFDQGLAQYAVNFLKEKGVNLLTGAKISEIEPNAVVYTEGDEEKRAYGNTIIWTVGVSGSDVIADSGFDQKRNRVVVSNHLNLDAHPEVFIVGDVSAVMDPDSNRPFPTTAQISLKQGEFAAKNIAHTEKHEALEDFSYESLGTVASLSEVNAIGEVGKRKLKGYPASVLKKIITNRSLLEDANFGTMLKKGRYDIYH